MTTLAETAKTAAWQFNEAVSLLREARRHLSPGSALGEEIDEGLPAIQAALVDLAAAVSRG